jgi:hypothetical protein
MIGYKLFELNHQLSEEKPAMFLGQAYEYRPRVPEGQKYDAENIEAFVERINIRRA